jgi:hypothetical protein
VNRTIDKVYLVALPLLMVSQYFVIHIAHTILA